MSDDGLPPRPSVEDTARLTIPPTRGPRRWSPSALVALLVAAALVGAAGGVWYNHWRIVRSQPAAAPPSPPTAPPTVSAPIPELVFSTTNMRPQATPEVLEAGAKEVFCFFSVPGVDPAGEVTAWWLSAMKNPVRAEGPVVKDPGRGLRGHVVLRPPGTLKAFESGIYEVGLRVGDEQVVEGSFAMLKGSAELLKRPPGMERYRPEVKDVVVAAGRTGAKPERPYVLPAGSSSVRVTFTYARALSGTAFTVQWLYEDGLIQQATTEVVIKAAEGLGTAWFATKPPTPPPAGRYAVLISLGPGTPPLAQESFWIGRQPRVDELQKAR